MKVLELSRNYCIRFYNGNFEEMIKKEDGVVFDDETVKNAFNDGNGTEKDLQRYMRDNHGYCRYYDLIDKKYITQ